MNEQLYKRGMTLLEVVDGEDTFGDGEGKWPIDATMAEIMDTDMPLVKSTFSMESAVEVMTEKGKGCVGVVDSGGCLMGIITDGDLRRKLDRHLLHWSAIDIMTWNPITVPTNFLAPAALRMMADKRITVLFVIDADEKPKGIVHIHDLIEGSGR